MITVTKGKNLEVLTNYTFTNEQNGNLLTNWYDVKSLNFAQNLIKEMIEGETVYSSILGLAVPFASTFDDNGELISLVIDDSAVVSHKLYSSLLMSDLDGLSFNFTCDEEVMNDLDERIETLNNLSKENKEKFTDYMAKGVSELMIKDVMSENVQNPFEFCSNSIFTLVRVDKKWCIVELDYAKNKAYIYSLIPYSVESKILLNEEDLLSELPSNYMTSTEVAKGKFVGDEVALCDPFDYKYNPLILNDSHWDEGYSNSLEDWREMVNN